MRKKNLVIAEVIIVLTLIIVGGIFIKPVNSAIKKVVCEKIDKKVWTNYWNTYGKVIRTDVMHCIDIKKYCDWAYFIDDECPEDSCSFRGGFGFGGLDVWPSCEPKKK